MFPIKLPNYWVKGQVVIKYSTCLPHNYYDWKQIVLDQDVEPSAATMRSLIEIHVPDGYKDMVECVSFEAAQLLDKVRYGQSIISGSDIIVNSMEFSITRYEYYSTGKVKKRSIRWHSASMSFDLIKDRIIIK